MTYIEPINAAIEAAVAKIVADSNAAAVAPVQAQLDTATQNLATVTAELSTANATVAADTATITSLQSQVTTLQAQVADLQAQIAALTTPPPQPSAGHWIKVPDDINTHDKKVFAHYFGPYPRSLDNKTPESSDYYSATYNNPASTPYGGILRDRPLYREPLAGSWQIADCTVDIDNAIKAGVDGFVCDLLGLSGSNYQNYENLKTAAQAYNTANGSAFYVIPMIDGNGATAATDSVTAGNYIATFAGLNCSYYRADGAFVISSFKAEAKTTSWWQATMAQIQAKTGKPVAFLAAFLNYSLAPNYTSVTWGEGSWGDGDDPAIQLAQSNKAAQSHSRAKVYMQPVGGQNVRPNQSVYDEACNTEAERASWERAIADGADFVQMVTWSDFSEGTHYVPSEARGFAPLDLASWYIVKFKTGSYAPILKDAVILSHRSHPVGAKPSGPQTVFMQHWNRGGPTPSAPRDTVEALTFLTAPATVTITVAGQATTYNAPAGMFAQTVPLGFGTISVSVNRNGSQVAAVTSSVVPVQVPVRDDYQYFWSSSARGTAGQRAVTGP